MHRPREGLRYGEEFVLDHDVALVGGEHVSGAIVFVVVGVGEGGLRGLGRGGCSGALSFLWRWVKRGIGGGGCPREFARHGAGRGCERVVRDLVECEAKEEICNVLYMYSTLDKVMPSCGSRPRNKTEGPAEDVLEGF